MSLRWIKTGLGLNVIHKGESKLIPVDHPHYEEILAGLKAGDETVLGLVDELKRKINDFSGVDFQIVGGELLFRGAKYHDEVLTEKILTMVERGFDAAPLVRFLEKVEQNPNPESVRLLWDWLQNTGLAIADDGDILGFKYVYLVENMPDSERKRQLQAEGAIYTDDYTKTLNMNPGKIVEMPRHRVVFDPNKSCAAGLHVGTFQYARGREHSVMVKVNPADVVSVPRGESHKMRVCRYTVLEKFDESQVNEEGLKEPVYKVDGTKMTTSEFLKTRVAPAGELDNDSADHWGCDEDDNLDDSDYEDDYDEDDDWDEDEDEEDWDEDERT